MLTNTDRSAGRLGAKRNPQWKALTHTLLCKHTSTQTPSAFATKLFPFQSATEKPSCCLLTFTMELFSRRPFPWLKALKYIYIRLLCFSAFNPPRTHRLTPEELRFHIRTCSRNTRVGEREEGVGGVSLTAEMIGLSRRQLDVITSLITKVNRLK